MMPELSAIPCPVCRASVEPAITIGPLAICGTPGCGASLVVDDRGVRRATAADTTTLSAADLQTLKKARNRGPR